MTNKYNLLIHLIHPLININFPFFSNKEKINNLIFNQETLEQNKYNSIMEKNEYKEKERKSNFSKK